MEDALKKLRHLCKTSNENNDVKMMCKRFFFKFFIFVYLYFIFVFLY